MKANHEKKARVDEKGIILTNGDVESSWKAVQYQVTKVENQLRLTCRRHVMDDSATLLALAAQTDMHVSNIVQKVCQCAKPQQANSLHTNTHTDIDNTLSTSHLRQLFHRICRVERL